MSMLQQSLKNTSIWKTLCGTLSLVGVILFTLPTLFLHFIQPQITILYDAMSYYVWGNKGWMFNAALVSLALGGIALAIGLVRSLNGKRVVWGVIMIGVWSIGLLIAAIYPTDPPGSWHKPPSPDGIMHFASAIYAFTSIPVAAILFMKAFAQDSRWKRVSRFVYPITILTLITYVLLVVSVVTIFAADGPPLYFGLTERLHILMSLCWLAMASIGLLSKSK